MQSKLSKGLKKGAVTPQYISPNQLTVCGFETPFEQKLTSENRWVKLCKVIPWDKIVGKYEILFTSLEGRPPISGRVVLGAVIVKHLLGLTDRETVIQIQENMFLQYFLVLRHFVWNLKLKSLPKQYIIALKLSIFLNPLALDFAI